MAVFSVSVPDPLLDQVDATIDARGYAGRSDLVRAALREFLARDREDRPGEADRSATLTLLYEEGSERKIGEIRHDFTGVIDAMMHAHVHDRHGRAPEGVDQSGDAHGLCLEVFVLKGPGTRIRQFQDRLRGLRETHLAQTVFTDAPPELTPTSGGQGVRR